MSIAANRRAMLVGATGLVGNSLLNRLIGDNAYSAISTLGRRAPELTHDRVTHYVSDSGEPAESVSAYFAGIDVLFCCLGTTIKRAGSREAFRAIDYELVVAMTRLALDNGASTFVVVSSVGADPDSTNFYLRTKGEMEQAVSQLGFRRLGIVRPSLLLGSREEFRLAEKLGQYTAQLINPLLAGGFARYRAVDADTVAAAMIGLDQSGDEGLQIIEGNEIRTTANRKERVPAS